MQAIHPEHQPANRKTTDVRNRYKFSALLKLCPFIEASALYDAFVESTNVNCYANYPIAAQVNQSFLICPSNNDIVSTTKPDGSEACGRTNYHIVYGDTMSGICDGSGFVAASGETGDAYRYWSGTVTAGYSFVRPCPRGFFDATDSFKTFGEITDGLSNSIAFSERVGISGPSRPKWIVGKPKMGSVNVNEAQMGAVSWAPALNLAATRLQAITCARIALTSPPGNYEGNSAGMQWGNGDPSVSGISIVMPPNSAACSGNQTSRGGYITTPSSNHTGGVNCAFGDGSVHFISENVSAITSGIDTRIAGGATSYSDSSVIYNEYETGGVSPWGVWGSLGAVNDGQAVSIP
jgi:prepilin-type processing-associated H-X9-DG protein